MLSAHPVSPPSPVREFSVTVSRQGRRLLFEYRVAADPASLRLPERRERARTDGLWRHTCLEIFVARAGSTEYVEYNFSPSDEWAAYRFSGYREGMQPHAAPAPEFVSRTRADAFELSGSVDLGWLGQSTGRAGVTAVIEDQAGVLSYWALEHPSGKPDFHHADGFIIELQG